MIGFIAAAGLGTRLGDLCEKRNKVLLDLGGETLLGNILNHFEQTGISETHVAVGYDAVGVRQTCEDRARLILNPFYATHGILSSFWLARPYLAGNPFLFTVGDHYFTRNRLATILADQPEAEVLVDVEMKPCDDEDMKVFINRNGKLRTITKASLDGHCIGEFTGMVRFSAEGSQQFFEMLDRQVWLHGIEGYVADILCQVNRKWELAFHLSTDHDRVEVDYPYDLTRARELYRKERTRAVAS